MPGLWLILLLTTRAPAQDASDGAGVGPADDGSPAEATEPVEDGVDDTAPATDDAPSPTDDAPLPVEPPPPIEPPPPPPIATELERAKEAYFNGGHGEAIETLTLLRERIDAGETVSAKVRGEVAIYLGEIHLLLREQEAAWRTFRWLLLQDPEYPILPALHPPEVVSWFEAARAEVKAELEANRPPPPPVYVAAPLPPWGYAPFGIPQFAQKQGARGALYAVGQTASAGVSVGMFVHLLQVNRRGHPDFLTDDEVAPYVRRWRNAVQWPSTAVFYTLWVASVVDGRASWDRSDHRIEVLPTADGAELRLSGRF